VTHTRVCWGAAVAAACGVLASATVALGDVVSIAPIKDNTLYESPTGSLSNGAGQHFFVGKTATSEIRRGVIAFDLAAAIPAGALVTRVDLTLSMSRTLLLGLEPVSLHRLLADWGEGTSDAALEEGGGAPATPGDATWIHRFFDAVFWAGPGATGDFVTTPSATVDVGAVGVYTFQSTAGMVADAQGWLDNPATNLGWILIGNESTAATTKRFDSRENPIASARPSLTVEFSAGQAGAGSVPDGGRVPGTPLTVEHAAGGDIRLSWGGSCVANDSDFEIYAGDMSDFTVYAPKFCSTAGATTLTFTPAAGSEFYLVVPRNAVREGSYGTNSIGAQRPAGISACLPQAIAACP
jgi:hypothetical protein